VCLCGAVLVCAGKWARGGWAGSDEQELQIKEETQVSAAHRLRPYRHCAHDLQERAGLMWKLHV
jgi:hypothetical protein